MSSFMSYIWDNVNDAAFGLFTGMDQQPTGVQMFNLKTNFVWNQIRGLKSMNYHSCYIGVFTN